MNALNYILENYQNLHFQESFGEKEVLKALVHTLQKEELHTLQKRLKRGSSQRSMGNVLYNEASRALNKGKLHGNESISSLLKSFTDKQSGKVVEARKKLRYRYDKQSFQIQRKILKAMLYTSKHDRLWAYEQLRSNWDKFFFEDVKVLWEQYHEKGCGRVVVKYFPMEYVYNNLAELDTIGDYANLCIKLIHHPLFQIDKKRLAYEYLFPEVEYLHILAKSKSKIEKGEATHILFNHIVYYINRYEKPVIKYDEKYRTFAERVKAGHISIINNFPISSILWCMGELGLPEELIAFEEWDGKVKTKFLYSEDLEYLSCDDSVDEENAGWKLYCQIIVECLPNEYQQLIQFGHTTVSMPTKTVSKPTKEELINNNPVINTLIKDFDLEVV